MVETKLNSHSSETIRRSHFKLGWVRLMKVFLICFKQPSILVLHFSKQKEIRGGRGCSTAVEHMPRNFVVKGLIPFGCWTFFFFLSFASCLQQRSVLNQLHFPVGCESSKNGRLAEFPGAEQALLAQNGF